MSLYGVHKVCGLVQTDLNFRERMRTDPAGAIADADIPLTDEERTAILTGDVATLARMGAHTFLLSRLPRFDSLGLSRDEYIKRMRALLQEA
jgi:hypothetical protein